MGEENSGASRFSQKRSVDFGTSHYLLIYWMAKNWLGRFMRIFVMFL
jgi:hypothetical protein